jgi:hypothetical protein
VVDFHVSPKIFWPRLRKTVAEFLAPQLVGVDPMVADGLMSDFEVDLRVLFDQLQNRVRNRRKDAVVAAAMSHDARRRQIVRACQTLNMAPPKRGLQVDMAKAARQKRLLAAAYHPDRRGGDESTRAELEAVLAAYEVLKMMSEEEGAASSTNPKEKKESHDGNGSEQ